MTTFDDRKKSFENKFARDAELQFKVEARRNRLLGLWAAELLGKAGEDAENYVHEVIKADVQEGGDADVFRKLSDDLGGRVDAAAIRAKMDECLAQAKSQFMNDS